MNNKLVIGTANFGLQYGIANNRKLGKEEALAILEYAHTQGVWGVDTAAAYGDAEEVLGIFFSRYGKVFRVISKLPHREYLSAKDVENEVAGSLRNMNVSSIDYLLLHSYETYCQYGQTVLPALQALRKGGIIGQYGISVYHPHEAQAVVQENKDDLAIEFPLNLFDRRFIKGAFLEELKERGAVLFARSAFLQGLFFADESKLRGRFVRVTGNVKKIRMLAAQFSLSSECIALLFSMQPEWLEGVVIGVDSKEQLVRNTKCLSGEGMRSFERLAPCLSDIEVEDEDIILPYRWSE